MFVNIFAKFLEHRCCPYWYTLFVLAFSAVLLILDFFAENSKIPIHYSSEAACGVRNQRQQRAVEAWPEEPAFALGTGPHQLRQQY